MGTEAAQGGVTTVQLLGAMTDPGRRREEESRTLWNLRGGQVCFSLCRWGRLILPPPTLSSESQQLAQGGGRSCLLGQLPQSTGLTPFGEPRQAGREGLRQFGIGSARSRAEGRETLSVSLAGEGAREAERAAHKSA